MKRQLTITLVLLVLGFTTALAQKQLKGKVKDTKGNAIASASVNLKDKENNILSFTRTDEKGNYTLSFTEENKNLNLEVTVIGYGKQTQEVSELSHSYDFTLAESQINLQTVVVKNRPSLTQKGDTLDYKTSDFAGKQDRSIGDVIRKMPGMEVADNGKISYNGKPISNLYLDKDNLLDDRYGIGTKSIPHGAVEKVQVIENDQPIKMMRKNNMSDDVALNLVFKEEAKLKVMGEVKAGLGTPDRFDGNVNAMLFKKNIKFINNAKGNNIGIDPGIDLTSFNMADYLKRLDNDKPSNFLSAGAAGVPTLPQNRSLFNKAGLANLNNLYKFNEDLQVKANIAYLYDERKQLYNKFSETYLPGQTIAYNEIQENRIRPQQLQAKLNLNGNAEKYYLNNTFTADYKPFSTNSNVVINGTGASQDLTQETFDLSNEFSYRKKLKSENTLNFYSFINRSSQPEVLNIRPGLNEAILNNGAPYAGLDQYVSVPTWYTNNFLSFAVVKGKLVQTYKAGFNIQRQELNSSLYRVQNNLSAELISADMINSLTWDKNKWYTEASYEYSGDKVKIGLNLPLSYNQLSYNDGAKNLDQHIDKVFLNPALNVKYQMSPENYITANYNFRNELGGIEDVYRGTILKNYRSLFANNAPVSERRTHFVGAGFNFRKAMQMLFYNFNISYSTSELNTISSYTLSNNIQQRIVLPLANGTTNLGLGGNISKYLFSLKSTVNAGISYNHTTFEQLQNNELLPFNANTITYKAGIEAKLNNFINWSYNANYSENVNRTKLSQLKTKFTQLKQGTGITATMFKSVFLTFSAEHIFTHQSSQPDLSYVFADVNLRYKVTKLKTDLEFGITNLANVKKFEAINVTANALTTGTYFIPGRVAMLKATFNY